MQNERKSLDAKVTERWGGDSQVIHDLPRITYNGATLALKYGPNWNLRATREELELAKFYTGELFL